MTAPTRAVAAAKQLAVGKMMGEPGGAGNTNRALTQPSATTEQEGCPMVAILPPRDGANHP